MNFCSLIVPLYCILFMCVINISLNFIWFHFLLGLKFICSDSLQQEKCFFSLVMNFPFGCSNTSRHLMSQFHHYVLKVKSSDVPLQNRTFLKELLFLNMCLRQRRNFDFFSWQNSSQQTLRQENRVECKTQFWFVRIYLQISASQKTQKHIHCLVFCIKASKKSLHNLLLKQ